MRTNITIDHLSTNVATLTTYGQAQSNPVPERQISDHQQTKCSQQLLVDVDNKWRALKNMARCSGDIPMLSFSLILPRWLAQYSLQISVCRSAQGWTLNLNPYRFTPQYTAFSRVLQDCDSNGLRRLLDLEQATVLDQDKHGWTALHVRYRILMLQSSALTLF